MRVKKLIPTNKKLICDVFSSDYKIMRFHTEFERDRGLNQRKSRGPNFSISISNLMNIFKSEQNQNFDIFCSNYPE